MARYLEITLGMMLAKEKPGAQNWGKIIRIQATSLPDLMEVDLNQKKRFWF